MSKGGILLLEHYTHHDKMWEVMQVGSKVKNLSAGDKVLTDSFPSNLHVFEDNVRIINESDVLMRWE